MASIIVSTPQGIRPRYNPRVISDSQAQTAQNCIFDAGDCRPLKAPATISALTATTETLFKIGEVWKEFADLTHVIPSPVSAEDSRYYYTAPTGGGKKMDDNTASPLALGVPRPSTGPTLTLAGTAGTNITRTSTYVYTRVTAWEEESAPSMPSAVVDVYEGQHITFSGLTDDSNDHVTHYRLYRAVGGETSTVWLLVPYQTTEGAIQYDADNNVIYDIPKASISGAKDGLGDDELTVEMETLDWHEPPDDLHNLIDFGNGTMGGLSGSNVCFSETWVPYAWPSGYQYTLDDTVVGLGHIMSVPLAFTSQSVYLFDGSSPDSLSQVKLSEILGCESAWSIANTYVGVFFASKDGLCLATTSSVDVLTLDVWTREQWSAFDLPNLMGFYYKKSYCGFFLGSDTGFIFNMDQTEPTAKTFCLSTVARSVTIRGAYLDPSNEKLYLILEDNTTHARTRDEFDSHATIYLTMTWKSKIFHVERVNMSTFKIGGDAGTSTVKIYADGALKQTTTATHNTPFRLVSGFRAQEYEVEISGTTAWTGWGIAQSMGELSGV